MPRPYRLPLVLAVIALAIALLSLPALLSDDGAEVSWLEEAVAGYRGDPPPWVYTQCTAVAPQPCEPWDGVDRTHPGYIRAVRALEAERAGW